MNTNKTSIVIIAVILAAVASLAFLIVDVTAIFITAYVFTLIAIAVFLFASLFMLSNPDTYPWGAAFPQQAIAYLVITFILGVAAVAVEQMANVTYSVRWLVIADVVILAIFAIRLIALNAGKVEIERVERVGRAADARHKELNKDKENYWK